MRHRLWERLKTGLAIAVSPIAEKNPVKVWAYRAPVVLSAERIIAMGAFFAWLNIAYKYPQLLNGWPLATFGVFVVLALPITRALSRAPAEATIDFAKALVGRFGRGRAAEVVQRTSASAETPVLPEYEGNFDELWEESDPAGLGHYEIGYTDRSDTPAEPRQESGTEEVAPSPDLTERVMEAIRTPERVVLEPQGETTIPREDIRRAVEAVTDRKPATEPATAEPGPTIKTPARPIDQSWPDDPSWLKAALAERHVVEVEGPGSHPRILEYFRATSYKATEDAVPWCSAALCFVMEQVGVKSPRNAAARSWLTWGRSIPEPRRGAIAVLSRGSSPTSGHVTLVLAATAEHVWGYGGNQSNRWSVQKYPRSRVLPGGYRIPA